MGTHYSYLIVEMDLPGDKKPSHNQFQSKSFFGQMEYFTLNKDGVLIHHYKVDNGGGDVLFEKGIILPWYRNVYFYEYYKQVWYEYIAVFKHGNCVRIDIHNVGKQSGGYPYGYETQS